ncbi:hypothetical protein [Ammoniphilus sp. YIM 78166]|uniref:DUF3846 domain-containing protein n=1 Tax=Ammoniphilus sp. YIM 78166 TaxID=1644106 RepID=UPI00107015C9|nr:hypothetical protein [Ammoniphilus sp. YIM 78166]
MITVIVKYPEQEPLTQAITGPERLEELMEGEFEVAHDDHLEGILILVNEEVRGIKPHNFTIEADGSHDWVYGTAIFTAVEDGQLISLHDAQIALVQEYFAKTRAYK